MPQPEGNSLTQSISPFLTNIAVGLMPTFDGFIAKDVFPTIPVAAPTGQYVVWKVEDFLRRGGKKLANFEAPPIEGFGTGSGTFTTSKWGVSSVYTAQEIAQARISGVTEEELKMQKTQLVTTKGVLEREIKVAALCQTAGNWTSTRTGVVSPGSAAQFTQWDQGGSDPVQDFQAAVTAVQLLTGYRPNVFVLPVKVRDVLLNNAAIIDRIKGGATTANPAVIDDDMLRRLFKIPKMLVPDQVYNSAAEGAAAAFGYIWSTTVWLGYVTPTPSRQIATAGYTFAWSGDTTAGLPAGVGGSTGPNDWGSVLSPEGLFIREYMQERPQGHFIDCETFDDPNVVSAGLGYTFVSPIA